MNDKIIQFDVIDEYGPQTYRGTFELSPADLDRQEIAGVGAVTVEARAEKGDLAGEYVVDGSSKFAADLQCSRCIEPYPFANDSTFHVRFRPRPETSGEEDEEVEITGAAELDVEYYSERQVPLRDLAIEQIQLSIPMKPLCEDGCLGLCPRCGVNRNREHCACTESHGDERWGALQAFREQLAKKKDV